MGNVSMKKVASGPRFKIKNEVVVIFSTTEVRDIVWGAARELGRHLEAGIRLEIPHSLQPSLKALEVVSYKLKKKYPDIKRNTKFDDHERDLVLDFCTDPSTNQPWRKARPAQAKALKSKLTGAEQAAEVTEDELDQMIGTS